MSEGIAPDAHDLAYWRERADDAEAACAELARPLTAMNEAHADAWKLIGRCDLAFELIATVQSVVTARATARQLQDEIKAASRKAGTNGL